METGAEAPKVVKVSGGRSTGMMLLHLLDSGALDPSRGGVTFFTSAFYAFFGRLKTLSEGNGVPFFWLEFCTYEDEVREAKSIFTAFCPALTFLFRFNRSIRFEDN